MIRVFVDASVLFAAAYSPTGSARDLILLAIDEKIRLVVSEQVLEEVSRNLARAYPEKMDAYRLIVETIGVEQVDNPTRQEVVAASEYTAYKDAAIVAAAIRASVDYLTT